LRRCTAIDGVSFKDFLIFKSFQMTVLKFCGYKQVACIAAKATGKRGEKYLNLVIFGVSIVLIGISVYLLRKYYFSASDNQIVKI
jgi:hypothetical protein